MTLFMRKQKDGSPLETMLLGNLLAAAVGLPFLRHVAPPPPQMWASCSSWVSSNWASPFVLYATRIRSIAAIEIVLISCLEPILNPILVFLIIGETAWTHGADGRCDWSLPPCSAVAL